MFEQRPARELSSTSAWSAGPATYAYASAEVDARGAEERENIVLGELLAAFPGFSLQDIAQAFTEANSNADATAVLLTTREPTVKPSGGNRNRSQHQPVVGSDDLLMEKYGMRVGEIINRECPKQSNGLYRNDGGTSSYPAKSPTRNGAPWDVKAWGGGVFMHKDGINGVSDDGALLIGKKKARQKGWSGLENDEATASREADERHLLSVLGDSFQLGRDVVRDVLDNFNGDKQKSIEVLLQMASSTSPKSPKIKSTNTHDGWYLNDQVVRTNFPHQLTKVHPPVQNSLEKQTLHDDFRKAPSMMPTAGGTANSYTHPKSKTEQDHLRIGLSLSRLKAMFPLHDDIYLSEVLQSSNFEASIAAQFLLHGVSDNRSTNSSAGLKVDQSHTHTVCTNQSDDSLLTTRPAPLRASWADVKPKITPMKQNFLEVSPRRGLSEKENDISQLKSSDDFGDYGRQRQCAQDHWRMMDYYFKEAAAAYDRGERSRAVDLSEKAKGQKQLAQQADERASQRIFHAKNKGIVNNITIDLHAQHVREAMAVLKRHLKTLSSIPSVDMLTVITGYGSHSNGRARIKPAVTSYLSVNRIPWVEVNEGCLTIKMIDVRDKELDMSDVE